jgi:uncharacterized protein YkwD
MNFESIQGALGTFLVGATAALGTFLPSMEPPSPSVPIKEDVLVNSSNLSLEPQSSSVSDISFQLESQTLLTNKVEGEEIKQVGQIEEEIIVQESGEVIGVIEAYGPVAPEPTPQPSAAPIKELVTEEKVVKVGESLTSPSPSPQVPVSPLPNPSASPIVAQTAGSLNSELIFQMINNHRASIGKPAFEKDERLCKIAQERVPQLQNEIFGSGMMHAGLKAMNLPFWNTENIAGYQTEKQTVDWWLSDYIHRVAIESDHKYSCGACLGNTCAQEFSSFVPK